MPLRRTLGLPSLTLYGVGIILGAGVYSVIGVAAGRTGEGLWSSFVIGALVALLTALSYAELATSHPRASAEYAYLRRAFPRGRPAAFATGGLVALSGAATSATVALAFARYLQDFVTISPVLVALALLALATAVNVVGLQASSWVNAIFTLIEAGGLVLFVVLGTRADGFGDALAATPHTGLISGAALVFFAFLGFENIANLAEEAREPARDLPRAILGSLGIATALYVLVALAAVALVPAAELAASDAPLADAARSASRRVAGALGGIALFATANTALVSLLTASRVIFGIARDGDLPRPLAATLPGRDTPWVASLVVLGLACALLPLGNLGVISSVSSFAALVAFAAVNAALIALRLREPGLARPFRVPGAIRGVPVLPVLGGLAALALVTQLAPLALAIGGGALVALVALALVWSQGRAPRNAAESSARAQGPS